MRVEESLARLLAFEKFIVRMQGIRMVNKTTPDLTRIDLNLFIVFEAIYGERNITRAAERLSVTQPTVSNALARLRRSLDDPLFVKTRTGMQPTALAESIAPRIGEALHVLRLVAKQGQTFDPTASRRVFRISVVEPMDSLLIPHLFAAIQAEAPDVELHINRALRTDLSKSLENGTVELALDIPLRDVSDLDFATIARENWVCAVRPDHPISAQGFGLEQYLSLPHLSVSSRPGGEGPVDIALRRSGRRRRIAGRIQQYASVKGVIQQSDMAVAGPESWLRSLGRRILPLPRDVRPFELRLYRHRHSDADLATQWMFDRLEAVGRTVLSSEAPGPSENSSR
jgi:DNA-binding transcriptional LysR family regulator